MRPLVSPLDIKFAYDSEFPWDSTYSFDGSIILRDTKKVDKEENKEFVIPDITTLQVR